MSPSPDRKPASFDPDVARAPRAPSPHRPQRIAVIGTGYVGLVTAACLAELGHAVVGVDADAAKVRALERHAIPIHEPGLEALVATHGASGRLRFTTDLGAALEGVELVFIAVGTPADA